MDPVKEAFIKAKEDIFNLQSQLIFLRKELVDIKRTLELLVNEIRKEKENKAANVNSITTETSKDQTHKEGKGNDGPQNSLKTSNNDVSTGNEGVPTDRQTDQQTDRQIAVKKDRQHEKDQISRLEHVSEVLKSLDNIKKDLRQKFKRLTTQEMNVFSQIYELEEKGFTVDYSLISQKLGLSESSIRDYTQKIIKKGVPITKKKENNKKILLKIDENLKKLATLQTLQTLREI